MKITLNLLTYIDYDYHQTQLNVYLNNTVIPFNIM